MSNKSPLYFCIAALVGFGAAHWFLSGASAPATLLRCGNAEDSSDRHILVYIAFPKNPIRRASGSAPVIVDEISPKTMLLDF